jgi:ketosteroid isomerase-like protein
MAQPRGKKEHPNVALARRLWSAAAEGDAETMRVLLADDVVWKTVGRNPLSGVRRGPDEVFDYLAEVGETADDLLSRMDEVYVSDSAAVIKYHVTARRSGKLLEMDYFLLLEVVGAKVANALMVPVDAHVNDQFWS